MANPEVKYGTAQQMMAIQSSDTEIYPYLSGCHHTDFKPDRPDREQLCHFVYIYPAYVPPGSGTYHQRPETLPFTRDDLQAFFNYEAFGGGYWSVYWASNARRSNRDTIHSDGYRSVVSFRTIEFMIRPMPDYKDRSDSGLEEPKRLYIGWLDVRACLSQALATNRPGPMRTFTGTANMNHPDRDKTREAMVGKAEITFEWRIDRVLPETMDTIVKRWRSDQFETSEQYSDKKKEFYDQRARATLNQQLQARDPATTQPGALQGYMSPGQPQQDPNHFPLVPVHHRGTSRRNKRRSSDMSASQDLSPSSKRRSFGSQSGSVSQSGSAPQSLMPSPEMRRPTPVGGWPQMTMPPPQNPQYAQPGMAYAYPGYEQALPAASPRLGQPQTPEPMQQPPARGWHRRHHTAGFSHGQSGGASSGYWGQPAPGPVSYVPGTGNYPPAVQGAAPAMPQYQAMPPNTSGGASYAASPSFHSPAMAAPGGNVYRQDPPPSSQPGWWEAAGGYMHSDQPYGGHQSGYPGEYRGGRGSGQR